MKPIVVYCDALSYSGTTWLNLTLGAHKKAFTLGPPHRLWNAKDTSLENLCLVHGNTCAMWNEFDKKWDRKENFFIALSRHTSKSHFIFDNPPAEFVEEYMSTDHVEVKRLRYLRDARAITASYARKFKDTIYYDTILPDGWFYHSFMAIPAQTDNPDIKYVYYEQCARDTAKFVKETGQFIGLNYEEGGSRFWEGDHHIIMGNAGPINMVKMYQGLPIPDFESKDLYEEQYRRLINEPDKSFFDERWKTQLTREDLFYFDLILGEQNSALGYERDIFSYEEIYSFWVKYSAETASGQRKPLPTNIMQKGQTLFNSLPEPIIAVRNVNSEQDLNDEIIEKVETVAIPDVPENAPVRKFIEKRYDSVIPADTETTQYYEDSQPDKNNLFSPYKVNNSALDEETINLNVNTNMFIAYGPTYTDKTVAHIAMDPLLEYRKLLTALKSNPNIIFKTYKDGLTTPPKNNEVFCLIRHDVDGDIVTAEAMAEIEKSLDIVSSYYLLHTAPYYANKNEENVFERNKQSLAKYKKLQDCGHEVAVHTDGLTLYQYEKIDGTEAIKTELQWLRDNGLEIYGTLAHNSFGQYGANNYSVFKNRPLRLLSAGGPKGVIHNGNYAPLQTLDEIELGLCYEGNDIFWQDETPVEYYCLMNQSLWYKQTNLYNMLSPLNNRPKSEVSWVNHEELIDDCLNLTGPLYLNLIIHPLQYGLRAGCESTKKTHERVEIDLLSGSTINANKDKKNKTISKVVEHDTNDTVHIQAGFVGDEAEYISIYCENEVGQAERPLAQFAEGKIRILFAGRDNFAGKSINTDSKISQMTARLLRIATKHKILITSTGFNNADLNGEQLKNFIDSLPIEQNPNIMFLGLGQIDLEDDKDTSLISFANSIAGKSITVFGVVENAGSSNASNIDKIAKTLRERCSFQVFNPYKEFANYRGSGEIMRQSVDEWAPLAHYLTAKLLSRGVSGFITKLAQTLV